jgi:uncharacterized protein YbbC (DUF1343 family)
MMRLLFCLLLVVVQTIHLPAQILIRAKQNAEKTDKDITVGAARFDQYLSELSGKRVAVVANHTSFVGAVHLVDTLLSRKIKVVKIFSPEHGFRGTADNGEEIGSGKDQRTGLPVISLYGDHRKPTTKDMKGIDAVLFDIQDVGVRFYTYISTMTYVMEACAEQNVKMIVLDRPNPNGHYLDGPILEPAYKSFVGLHPVPIVHGMTIAEYAQMVNGEKWLTGGVKCDLKVITCLNYTHDDLYQLPINPSPNLPNMSSVYLYPSLCLFEGTFVSVGRGTGAPFQIFGHPQLQGTHFSFTPAPKPGAKKPLYEGQLCNGYDLREFGLLYIKDYKSLYLYWLIASYNQLKTKGEFFNNFFDKLAGTSNLRNQVVSGKTEEQIRASWQPGLSAFRDIRVKYLLYQDFN